MNLWCDQKNRIRNFIDNTTGNSIPLVLLIALVVLIIGGAVAYGSVQVFSAVRGETHSQMTYFAAETALERSMCSLDSHITKEDYAASKNISYTGNEIDFIENIINSLNNANSDVIRTTDVGVYSNGMDEATVSIEYSWLGGYKREGLGLRKIKIPITISATARMENGIFKSYGKKAVATREYEVWMYRDFKLNGAVYALGDMLATTTIGTERDDTFIKGNVYVFGTGLEKTKRMEQYYNGGICADKKAVLKIVEGNAYTSNLVRAGTFDESDSSSESCAIVVEKDIIAQGIQVFGSGDSIVVLRDAYTFDDIELSGANSYIVVNGNYYGLNMGDGVLHDTSSAIVNIAPRYSQGFNDNYLKSRIIVNGHTFVNGSTFRIKDPVEGTAGHKMEDASLAWIGNEPAYIALNIAPDTTPDNYYAALFSNKSNINGFSVLLQEQWDTSLNISNWRTWINDIKVLFNNYTNSLTNTPSKIIGFCNNALAANDRIYFSNEDDISIPDYDDFICNIANDIDNIGTDFFQKRSIDWDGWAEYTDYFSGMPAALEELKVILQDHVQVFAKKEFNGDDINYSFTPGFIEDEDSPDDEVSTLFLALADNLKSINTTSCILKYEVDGETDIVKDVIDDLINNFTEQYEDGKYFIVLNFDPQKELHIAREMNGIIFSLGKVVIERGGKVNGAVIAAGRGYDPDAKVMGSAAENDAAGNPRLPRVVIGGENDNVNEFKNWEYAALVFENGGSIVFPGREELLDAIKTSTNHDLSSIF